VLGVPGVLGCPGVGVATRSGFVLAMMESPDIAVDEVSRLSGLPRRSVLYWPQAFSRRYYPSALLPVSPLVLRLPDGCMIMDESQNVVRYASHYALQRRAWRSRGDVLGFGSLHELCRLRAVLLCQNSQGFH